MSVINCTHSEEYNNLIASGAAIIVFTASWCGPCKRIDPLYKQLAKQNATIKFVRVDVDDASEAMANHLVDVTSVPTFKLYKDGNKVDQFSGASGMKLKERLEKIKPPKPAADSTTSKPDAENTEATPSPPNGDEDHITHEEDEIDHSKFEDKNKDKVNDQKTTTQLSDVVCQIDQTSEKTAQEVKPEEKPLEQDSKTTETNSTQSPTEN